MSCAPENFQKIIERILLPCKSVVNFIVDIVVFGNSEKEHDENLKEVLEALKKHDILLRDKKCIFKVKSLNFLSLQLSQNGVKPLEKYTKVIENFRDPQTVEELMSFLGLVNFLHKWVPDLATLTEPLRKILRLKLSKTAKIEDHWGQEQTVTFKKLKTVLSNIKTLGYYDPKDRTQVFADASPVGLGAVLIQHSSASNKEPAEPRVIAYGSKSLTVARGDTAKRKKKLLLWCGRLNILTFIYTAKTLLSW